MLSLHLRLKFRETVEMQASAGRALPGMDFRQESE